MTRDECMLKLLAVEPETRLNLIRITGWPPDETRAVLKSLHARGEIVAGYGATVSDGECRYRVKATA